MNSYARMLLKNWSSNGKFVFTNIFFSVIVRLGNQVIFSFSFARRRTVKYLILLDNTKKIKIIPGGTFLAVK